MPSAVPAGEMVWLLAACDHEGGRRELHGRVHALGKVLGGDTDCLFAERIGKVAREADGATLQDAGVATVEVGVDGFAVRFGVTMSVAKEDCLQDDRLQEHRASALSEALCSSHSRGIEVLELRRCSDLLWLQRREWVRVPVSIDGVMQGGRSGAVFGCRIVNLSGGGAMVVAERQLEGGSLASLMMDLQGDAHQVLARVVSCDDGVGDGHAARLAFEDLSDAQRRRICGYVLRRQLVVARSRE